MRDPIPYLYSLCVNWFCGWETKPEEQKHMAQEQKHIDKLNDSQTRDIIFAISKISRLRKQNV